jgi:hypothetical protein
MRGETRAVNATPREDAVIRKMWLDYSSTTIAERLGSEWSPARVRTRAQRLQLPRKREHAAARRSAPEDSCVRAQHFLAWRGAQKW